MNNAYEDKIIAVLMDFYEKQEVPRLLNIHKRVDAGNRLNDRDIIVMHDIYIGIHKIEPIFERHPEHQTLFSRIADLYKDTSNKAFHNES